MTRRMGKRIGQSPFLPGMVPGMMPARLTGNVALDMALTLCIPLMAQGCITLLDSAKPTLFAFVHRLFSTVQSKERFYRTVEYEKMLANKGNEEDTSEEGRRNNILQKAILLYINKLGIKYNSGALILTAVKESGHISTEQMTGRVKMVYGGTAQQLNSYSVGLTPPKSEWVSLIDGIIFRMTSAVDPDGGSRPNAIGSSKRTVKYEFVCVRPDGGDRIQAFIGKAFAWYRNELESTEDHSRYLYNLQCADISHPMQYGKHTQPFNQPIPAICRPHCGNPGLMHRYKRYKLGDVKDFDTLFFPEKANLLRILDHFENKTGKYGIKGYPHKLGLLLHGPPGTGKTSLIKAMAHHTKRHIVNVPLAKIPTNQDLMDIMFDQSFTVMKMDMPVSLGYEHVIFVMEDIDAASPIVRSREKRRRRRKARKSRSVRQSSDRSASEESPVPATSKKGVSRGSQEMKALPADETPPISSPSTPLEGSTPTIFSKPSGEHHLEDEEVADGDGDGDGDANHGRSVGVSLDIKIVGAGVSGVKEATLSASPKSEVLPPTPTPSSSSSTSSSLPAFDKADVALAHEVLEAGEGQVKTADRRADRAAEDVEADAGPAAAEPERRGAGAVAGETPTMRASRKSVTSEPASSVSPAKKRRGRDAKDEDVAAVASASSEGDEEDDESDDDSASEGEEEVGDKQKEGEAVRAAIVKSLGGNIGSRKSSMMMKYASSTDRLDLSGLLNVLDGVVDTPGRIIIMTTNHPETLDPALIRPGRIDKRINLGYMGYDAALSMTQHFFKEAELRHEQRERLREVFEARREVTPAVVEQLAGEFDTVDGFLAGLECLP